MKYGWSLFRIKFLLIFMIFLINLPLIYANEEEVYVEINKSTKILTIFLNDTPIYRFPIATGRTKELTPEGEFQIVNRIKNPWYIPKDIPGGSPKNPLGTRWLGLNVPGTGGYKYGIHGTNNEYSIGYSISSGCIRMRNKDIEWLFNHLPLHTRVVIK